MRSSSTVLATLLALSVGCNDATEPANQGGRPLEPDAAPHDAGVVDAPAPDVQAPAPSIGPGGGEVRTEDGAARLTVPAGALESEQPITITKAPGVTGEGLGSDVYDFAPNGLSFAKDTLLCLRPAAGADTSKACLGYLAGPGKWVCEDKCLTKEGDLICGTTNHFTSFAILLSGGSGASTECADSLVPPTGGSLASPNGHAKLTVPAGALAATTRITVNQLPTPQEKLASAAFDFSPDGMTFAKPAQICITPTAGVSLASSCLGYLSGDGKWVCEDTCLERTPDQVCGTTTHFTNFAILLSGGKGVSCP